MRAHRSGARREGIAVTWVAVAIGGSALIGAGASYAGSKKQADAAKNAAGINLDWLKTVNQQQQPYIQSGYGAMGRLNTLLGLSPNPNAQRMAPPANPGYRPTPGGGVEPIMQMGQQQPPGQGGYFGIPENAGNMNLRRILALRAQNGDTEAARMLGNV
jgi:hypothetical protein